MGEILPVLFPIGAFLADLGPEDFGLFADDPLHRFPEFVGRKSAVARFHGSGG
jgi:hypothetical protein